MRSSRLLLPLVLAVAVLAGVAATVSPVLGIAVGILVAGGAIAFQMPIERLAFLCVCGFLLTVTWNGLRLGGGAVANAFMVLAFASVIAYVAIERRKVPLPGWLFLAGVGFALTAMVTLVFPPSSELLNATMLELRNVANEAGLIGELYQRSDLATLMKVELALVLIPVMLAIVGSTPARIARLIDMFVISAAICAWVGVVDYAGFHIAPTEIQGTRSSGLTIHPNYLALTCAIAIPLAFLWINRPGRWRQAGVIAVAILLAGVFATGSRAGTVAAVLAVIASSAFLPRLRRALPIILPVAGMGMVAVLMLTDVGGQVIDQVRLGSNNYTAQGSDLVRDRAYDLAFDQFTARPISGVGLNVIQDAHNIYMQLLAAGGVIAMASFLVFIGGLARSTLATVRASTGATRDTAVALGIAGTVWLANGVYDSQLVDKYLYVVPGFIVALSYAVAATAPARVTREERALPQPPEPSLAGAPSG